METQEFISKYLSEARGFLSMSEAAEISLYIVFYLSLNKDRIKELRNIQAHHHNIDFVAYVYKDFSNSAEKNHLLEDNFFDSALSRINARVNNNETVARIFHNFLNHYSSQKDIDFSLAFNLLVEFLLNNSQHEITDFYLSEQEANLLFDENLKEYLSDCKVVYFPFLRTAKDVTLLEKFGLSKDCLILANEMNHQIYSLAKMNLIINGFTNFQIEKDFAFNKLPISYLGKVDFVFSFSYLGMDLRHIDINSTINKVYNGQTEKPSFLNTKRIESALLMSELSLHLINENGKVLAHETNIFFSDSTLEEYRKYLIQNQFISKIVKKDKKKKTISAVMELVLFDKDKTRSSNRNIQFLSNDELFILNTLGYENKPFPFGLSKNDYNLSPNIYLNPSFHELENQLKQASNLSTIENIATSIERGSHVAPNKQTSKNQKGYVHYVKGKDLSKSTNGNYLDLSKIDIYVEKSKKSIDYSCVLVSLLGTDLNSTCFNYEDQAIMISSDIFAVQLNQKIKLEYFVYQLKTRLVQIQAEMLAQGAVISRIDKDDFLNIQFVLPSLEEQEKQLFEIRNVLANQAIAQQEVNEILNQAKYSDYQLIGSIAHSYKNKITPLLTDYKVLKKFLSSQKSLDLNTPMRPIFEGETAEDVDTFQDIIERIERQLATLPNIFDDVKILQQPQLNKEQEDISKFIKTVASNYKNIGYKINVISPKKSLFVFIDNGALRSVIENLIDNAKNHAFKGIENREDCKVEFEIKKVEEKVNGIGGEYAQIIYRDNGKGFPKGYTFESYKLYGHRSVQSDGTGIGGFIISKMIELHGGTINLLSTNSSDEFTTQISILLPLS